MIRQSAKAGFTMIELILSMVVFAVSGILVIQLLGKSNRIAKESDDVTIGSYMARDLLDEIISKSFRDPQLVDRPSDPCYNTLGLDTNAACVGLDDRDGSGTVLRANFDDVDDFNGYQDPAGGPVDANFAINIGTSTREEIKFDGSSYDLDGDGTSDLTAPDLSKFRRTVSVQYVDDADYTVLKGSMPTNSKIIVVTVYWPDPKARPVNSATLAYTTASDPQAIRVRLVTLTAIKTDFEE